MTFWTAVYEMQDRQWKSRQVWQGVPDTGTSNGDAQLPTTDSLIHRLASQNYDHN